MYIAGLRRYTERIILARPCLHCLARIVAFDVSKVVYSIPLGWESINL
jgi:deoxycytidylate deaminase